MLSNVNDFVNFQLIDALREFKQYALKSGIDMTDELLCCWQVKHFMVR